MKSNDKAAIVFAGIIWISAMNAEAAPSQKPNVLLIISDDLTATALSCYGNSICRTPNIDRLAAEGTHFTRCFCQGTSPPQASNFERQGGADGDPRCRLALPR